jgi:hypothetical protein
LLKKVSFSSYQEGKQNDLVTSLKAKPPTSTTVATSITNLMGEREGVEEDK